MFARLVRVALGSVVRVAGCGEVERGQVIARPNRILLALLAFSLAVGLGVAMPPLIIGSGILLVLL